MTAKHFLLLSGCLVGLGGMTSALQDWHAAMTPTFIGGAIAVIGTQIGAIFSDRP